MENKRVVVYVPQEDHIKLKVSCAKLGMSVSEWFRRQVSNFVGREKNLRNSTDINEKVEEIRDKSLEQVRKAITQCQGKYCKNLAKYEVRYENPETFEEEVGLFCEDHTKNLRKSGGEIYSEEEL